MVRREEMLGRILYGDFPCGSIGRRAYCVNGAGAAVEDRAGHAVFAQDFAACSMA